MRQLFTPRWLVRHLLALVLIAGCLLLGLWQLSRATGGNMLSWAYTLEWPLFAAFFGWMWFRMARDAISTARGEDPYVAVRPAPLTPRRPPAPLTTRQPSAALTPGRPPAAGSTDDDDPQLAAYNRYLAWLAAHPDRKPSDYRPETTTG